MGMRNFVPDIWLEEKKKWQNFHHDILFFLRDDDAYDVNEKWCYFADAVEETPVLLGIVPFWLKDNFAEYCHHNSWIQPAMHGAYHKRSSFYKKCEFSPESCYHEVYETLQKALLHWHSYQLKTPCFYIPPWNRMSEKFYPILQGLGFKKISKYHKVGTHSKAHHALQSMHTEIDIIDWRNEKKFIGTETFWEQATKAAAFRRENEIFHHPIGILTHHGVHTKAINAFLKNLIAYSNEPMHNVSFVGTT